MRELEGVRQQVLQYLLQPLGIGQHRARKAGVHVDEEIDVLRLGHVPERAFDVAVQIVQQQVRRVDDDRSRLDLGEVENVIDERKQIVA